MAQSEFSETQFVMGYLGEYFNRIRRSAMYLPFPFILPSTKEEPLLASDFVIGNLTHIDFFQFKRSQLMKVRRGDAEIAASIPSSFRPYYRLKIYNDLTRYDRRTRTVVPNKHPQFEQLKKIAALGRAYRTYYCAPLFHSDSEFQQHFWNQTIMDNSILIDCDQFNKPIFNPPHFDINDGSKHFLIYKSIISSTGTSNKIGFMCSEPKEIEIKTRSLEIADYVTGKSSEIIDGLYELVSDIVIEKEGFHKVLKSDEDKLLYSINFLGKQGIVTNLNCKTIE